MRQSSQAEKSLFRRDVALLSIFMFLTIAVFYFALVQIIHLTGTGTVGCIVISIAAITIVSIIWASAEVMVHLKRNREYIYNEDLKYQKLIHEQNNV